MPVQQREREVLAQQAGIQLAANPAGLLLAQPDGKVLRPLSAEGLVVVKKGIRRSAIPVFFAKLLA